MVWWGVFYVVRLSVRPFVLYSLLYVRLVCERIVVLLRVYSQHY